MLSAIKFSTNLINKRLTIVVLLVGASQVRLAHTDIHYPDFSDYRRDVTKSNTADSDSSNGSRKAFTYIIAAGQWHVFSSNVINLL